MSGNFCSTGGSVFAVLQQYFMSPVFGDKLVISAPHPDAPGTSAVTLSVVTADEHIEIDSDIEAVLRALSHTTSAVGKEQTVIVEKLSVSVDEEAKYVITIKKK